ncbi:MAG: hypothetical protein RMK84_20700 [Oscillochloridaceae bacterium]|nr:hypothetical protein [Oscillochloridaceae bacterium]
MSNTLNYLDALLRDTDKTEAEIIALAFQAGVKQLWRERVLGRFLRGELTRSEAVRLIGLDWVELAERQHAAMREDLAWALKP